MPLGAQVLLKKVSPAAYFFLQLRALRGGIAVFSNGDVKAQRSALLKFRNFDSCDQRSAAAPCDGVRDSAPSVVGAGTHSGMPFEALCEGGGADVLFFIFAEETAILFLKNIRHLMPVKAFKHKFLTGFSHFTAQFRVIQKFAGNCNHFIH